MSLEPLEAPSSEARLFDALEELFQSGELRFEEFETGWRGYRKRGDNYFWVDTREPHTWASEIRVTEGAVKAGIDEAIASGWSP